jgi:hypothetical protein
MLLGHIINIIENKEAVEVIKPNTKSYALKNHRNILKYLKMNKKFPIEYSNCEEELYKSDPIFITEFLNVIKKLYSNKTK